MATAPKKKPAPPAPLAKTTAKPKAKPQVQETAEEEEPEEETPAPKKKPAVTATPKKKPEPEPEPEAEEEEAPAEEDGAEEGGEEGGEEEGGDEAILPADDLLDLAKALKSNFAQQTAKESEQDYYKRLVATLAKCSDEQYDSLTEDAQNWYNAAVEAVNKGKTIPALEGHDTPAAKAAAAPAKKGNTAALEEYRRKKAEAEARGETLPKKEKKKGTGAPRTSNATYPVFLEMAKDHKATLEQVITRLKKQGIEVNPSTASTTRGGAIAMLRALKEAGKYDSDE